MITLEPPLTRSLAWPRAGQHQALTEGPRYARTSGMSRWHRVRSGVRRDEHTTWHLWCGQMANEAATRAGALFTADTIPDNLPACGTCEGRARGAGQDDWPIPGNGVVFNPRRLTPPKHCPGSRKPMYAQLGTTAGRCLVCGAVEALRVMGGPYDGRVAIVQHPPGEGLVPGCPFHAWTGLVVRSGVVVCLCTLQEGP